MTCMALMHVRRCVRTMTRECMHAWMATGEATHACMQPEHGQAGAGTAGRKDKEHSVEQLWCTRRRAHCTHACDQQGSARAHSYTPAGGLQPCMAMHKWQMRCKDAVVAVSRAAALGMHGQVGASRTNPIHEWKVELLHG